METAAGPLSGEEEFDSSPSSPWHFNVIDPDLTQICSSRLFNHLEDDCGVITATYSARKDRWRLIVVTH